MKTDTNLALSYLTIRRALGVLGILLPLLVFLCSQMAGPQALRVSISSYYFTNVRDMLVGILCALSMCLIAYKGYDRLDNAVSSVAGVFALGIAWFPACGESHQGADYLFRFLDSDVVTAIHFISAGCFFGLLAFMSFFLFTKTGGKKKGNNKNLRNVIYRVCGAVMMAALLGMLVVYLLPADLPLRAYNPVFWLETLALLAFGISWLIKGETLFQDKR